MNDTKKQRPLNPRQERFAQLVAQGLPASQAYVEAGYSKQQPDATANGCLLLKTPRIAALVAEIQDLAASLEATLLTIVEKRRFLAELVRTPIGSIGPDSWLCQEFREEVRVREQEQDPDKPREDGAADPEGAREIVLRRRVKIADKLRAIALDSKLAGHITKPDPGPPEASGQMAFTLDSIRQAAIRMAKEKGASLLWLQ